MESLSSYIGKVRALAGLAYDKAVSQELTRAEVAKAVEPFRAGLHAAIKHYSTHSLKDCVQAIQELENECDAHRESMLFYKKKHEDTLAHIMMIKTALEERMINQGVDFLHEQGFAASLVSKNGRFFVETR